MWSKPLFHMGRVRGLGMIREGARINNRKTTLTLATQRKQADNAGAHDDAFNNESQHFGWAVV